MINGAEFSLSFLPENHEDFFSNLTLADIYGRRRVAPKKIPITKRQYMRWTGRKSDEVKAEELEFAYSHEMEDIGSLSYEGGHCYIKEDSFIQYTHWVPLPIERQIILNLTHAVSDNGSQPPTILDAGCGSGFLTQLLALEDNVSVVGVDPAMRRMGVQRLPFPPEKARCIVDDLWNVLSSYGPQYPADLMTEYSNLLKSVRGKREFLYAGHFGLHYGNPLALNGETKRLQEIAPEFAKDSQVDLVICSLMPKGIELTIPIRDGIFPKAILYVRLVDGHAGAGDYYLGNQTKDSESVGNVFESINKGEFRDEDDIKFMSAKINPYSFISYNPGTNYHTLFRWPTFWEGNWDVFNGNMRDGFEAEVIVQLRNDIVLRPNRLLPPRRWCFDDELERALSEAGENWEQFVGNIMEIEQSLCEE